MGMSIGYCMEFYKRKTLLQQAYQGPDTTSRGYGGQGNPTIHTHYSSGRTKGIKDPSRGAANSHTCSLLVNRVGKQAVVVYSEDSYSCSDFHLWFVEDFCSSEIIAMDPGVDRYYPLTLTTIVLILTTHIKEQVGGWPGWPELSNTLQFGGLCR